VRKAIVHGAWLLAVAALVTGCGPAIATSASGGSTQEWSASVLPLGASTGASNPSADPLGMLPIPSGATPWTSNTDTPMGLVSYIDTFYIASGQAQEKSLYTRRGFVSGEVQGWINVDGSQQRIAIARFATANGAISAFDDLTSTLDQKPAPWTMVSDAADGAVGAANPQPDSLGNDLVDITARVGDYLVDVHEYTAMTPDPAAAKALLLQQVKALEIAPPEAA
jgi:hypothetical protein